MTGHISIICLHFFCIYNKNLEQPKNLDNFAS